MQEINHINNVCKKTFSATVATVPNEAPIKVLPENGVVANLELKHSSSDTQTRAEPSATIRLRPISQEDFDFVVSHDRELFPTNDIENTIHSDILYSWFLRERFVQKVDLPDGGQEVREVFVSPHPEFAMIYDVEEADGTKSIGAFCITFALTRKGFERITHGKCMEMQLDPLEDLFHAHKKITVTRYDKDGQEVSCTSHSEHNALEEVGLYVFHIDKFTNKISSLYEKALSDMGTLVDKLRETVGPQRKLKVIGLGAYGVSYSGISLFYNKLNCLERPTYISKEHVMIKKQRGSNDKVVIFRTSNLAEVQRLLKEGYSYQNRCKMLTSFPDECSLIWLYIRSEP